MIMIVLTTKIDQIRGSLGSEGAELLRSPPPQDHDLGYIAHDPDPTIRFDYYDPNVIAPERKKKPRSEGPASGVS